MEQRASSMTHFRLFFALCFLPAIGLFQEFGLIGVPCANAQDAKLNDDMGTSEQRLPALAMNKYLYSVTCWEDHREASPRIYAQQYSAKGTIIRKNFKINGHSLVAEQFQPDVAMDDLGHFAVAWVEKADSFNIYVRLYGANAVPITTIMQVSEIASPHVNLEPVVAMNEKGSFIISWKGGDVFGDIYAQLFDQNGNKIGGNFRVNDVTEGVQMRPDAEMQTDGSFIIVWEDGRTANDYAIYAQRFSSSGAPLEGNIKISHHPSSTHLAANATVAVQQNGDFLVCWNYGEQIGQEKIYGRLMKADLQLIKTDFIISSGTGVAPMSGNLNPHTCSRASSGYSVTWQGDIGVGYNIYFRLLDSQGNLLGDKMIINATEMMKNKTSPDHGESQNGSILFIWQDDRAGNADIYGSWRGPVQPLNVIAGFRYNGMVPICWDPVYGDDRTTKYEVHRADALGAPLVKIATVDLLTRGPGGNLMRDYIDTTVTNGQTYYYAIKADRGDESSLSYFAMATPSLPGNSIASSWAKVKPLIDGQMQPDEWEDATSLNISAITMPIGNVTLHIKNDANQLYLAVDDPNDAAVDPANILNLLYDWNHDKAWPAASPSNEGLISFNQALIALTGYWGKYPNELGADAIITAPPGVTAKISNASGHVQYEAALAAPGASGKILGFAVSVTDPGNYYPQQYGSAGLWPRGALWEAAESLGDLVLAAAADTLVDLNWSMFKQCRERTSWVKDEKILTPPFSYSAEILFDPLDPIEFVSYDNTLYAGTWGMDYSSQARFAAYDVSTGLQLWPFVVPNSTFNAQMCPAVNDSLFICSGQDAQGLYALERSSGLPKWSNHTGAPMEGHPILDGDRIYFHFQNLFCINASDGSTIWSRPLSGSSVTTVDQQNVYISMNNHLQAYDKFTGSLIWSEDCQTSQAVTVDKQYVYTFNNNIIVAREKDTGQLLWTFTPPGATWVLNRNNGIAIHHTYLCFTTYENAEKRGQLFTLNKADGSYRWHVTFDSTGASWPTIANNVVYVVNGGGSRVRPNSRASALWGFDIATGNQVFLDYSTRYYEQPIVANHRLFVLASGNKIKVFSNSPISGLATAHEVQPQESALRQNYPNPFNSSTTIEFALAESGFMTLKIFNLLGEKVATLLAEKRTAGAYKLIWDAKGIASGVYLYRLEAGELVQTKKLILMR
jgi:outer membrane protein assembly factor BamB